MYLHYHDNSCILDGIIDRDPCWLRWIPNFVYGSNVNKLVHNKKQLSSAISRVQIQTTFDLHYFRFGFILSFGFFLLDKFTKQKSLKK